MARFYQTSEMDFIDYLQEPQDAASAATVSSAFGDINSIPEDREILNNVLSGYEAEINEMTTELQADPRAMKRLEPRIASLRQRMAQDRQTGILKAIEDRYNQDIAAQEGLATSLKDDPIQLSMAAQEYRSTIPPLNFDPQTRTFNQITPMSVAKPLLQKDWEDWKTSNAERVEETVLDMLQERQKLDPTNTLLTESKVMGVTRERATASLAAAITPDMVRAAEQQRRYYNLGGDPEGKFLNQDGTPNLNTQIGRQIASTVEAISRTTIDKWRNVVGNKAAEMAIGNRLQNQPAEWWAQKLSAAWGGVGAEDRMSRERSLAATQEMSGMLVGTKTKDGGVVERVERATNGEPAMVVRYNNQPKPTFSETTPQEERQRLMREWEESSTTRRIPLDVSALPTAGFSEEFTGKIGTFATQMPNWDRSNFRFRATPQPIEQPTQPRGQQTRQQAPSPSRQTWDFIQYGQ